MIVFFPIGHEEGRIWSLPYVTIGLILLCSAIFALTKSTLDNEHQKTVQIQSKIQQIKVAAYMDAHRNDFIGGMIAEDASNFYEVGKRLQERIAAFWKELENAGDASMDNPYFREYLTLTDALEAAKQNSSVLRYGLVPARPTFTTLITSMFLHGSLGHLLMNMIFLFLVGFALEDVWGKVVFTSFYLVSGIMAGLAHIAMFPGSEVPCIGASGAIAGLMGGFLVRFFKVRIQFVYYYILLRIHFGRFALPAYVVLPAWLGSQLLYASLTANGPVNVAFWAHIGGFGFGMAAALPLTLFGFGRKSVSEEQRDKMDMIKKGVVVIPPQDNLLKRKEKLLAALNGSFSDELEREGNALLKFFVEMDNFPEAVDLTEKLCGAFPEMKLDNRYLLKVGDFLEHQWKNEQALTVYRKVADSLLPGAGKALLAIGRIYNVRLKDIEKASMAYQAIIENLPDDPAAPVAKIELKKISSRN